MDWKKEAREMRGLARMMIIVTLLGVPVAIALNIWFVKLAIDVLRGLGLL